MPILHFKEREATTQSRFSDNRDRATPSRARYPVTDFVRRWSGISFRGAEAGSLTTLRIAGGLGLAARVLLPETGKE